VTGVGFRSCRLTHLSFKSCSLFYSNTPLHVSVVRTSSWANIYITNYHDWREVQGFPSKATIFQKFFTILFQFCAPCFVCTTIFIRKYGHLWCIYLEIYTSKMIMAGMRFRRFPITQLCFNSCSLFHSNYLLHFSIIRPSSCANIYITKYNDWHEVQEFPSNETLLQ
jgi:hypothetical protein